ncbi:MAG: hypothetical protein FWH23_07640 [Bacteroidales bacterium]|nr:hypothetical protein [Bacteroidales bacterium]MCL2133732.1 hypothetical protein [Bacteroidales bacterium]
MIKYDLVLYRRDTTAFLERLQALGVVDVRRSNRPIDKQSASLLEEINRCNAACKLLSKHKTDEVAVGLASEEQPLQILHTVEKLWTEHTQLTDRRAKLMLEIEVSRPWGNWGTAPIDCLKTLDITPHFYIAAEKNYAANAEQWEQEYVVKIINRERDKVYFAVLELSGEAYSFPLQEARLPVASETVLKNELDNIDHRKGVILRELEKYALQKERLADYRNDLVEQLELYLAGQSAQAEAEDTLSVLTAFVPKPQNDEVMAFLEQEQAVYLQTEATIEDDPPVKLKNNKFSRLFEPIGSMYMPPRYDELDVTAYFSPFYMLFFGFCLGDMGYGLVLLLGATIAKFKLPKMRPILTLAQFLGIGAIIMPLTSGGFFGMKLGELFNVEGVFLDDLAMFWLAIAFGGAQIIFAKAIQTINLMCRYGWQHGLDQLGWTLLLIDAALLSAKSFLGLPLPSWAMLAILCIGLTLVLFFTGRSKNIFVRFAKGIASLWDITGIFGDLLSYIRLFGLGAAGGILGFVVNTVGLMCMNISYVGWLIGGLILIVGHIGVLALSALGAFVHPMRLTFVEFYKNVGFTGGGRYYNPLKKLKIEN